MAHIQAWLSHLGMPHSNTDPNSELLWAMLDGPGLSQTTAASLVGPACSWLWTLPTFWRQVCRALGSTFLPLTHTHTGSQASTHLQAFTLAGGPSQDPAPRLPLILSPASCMNGGKEVGVCARGRGGQVWQPSSSVQPRNNEPQPRVVFYGFSSHLATE